MSGQLSLDGMPTRLLRVTPARLATWDDCPRRFRLTYVDRPTPPRGGPRAASTLGAVVHLALRSLFALPGPRRTPERAVALLDASWSSEGFRDDAQAAEHRARARGWVADYAEAHAETHGADTEVLAVERWVSAAAGELVVEGRVDRLDARGGEAVVVDYKTGARVPDADDARRSPALALYATATAATTRRRCRRVELHHLPSGTVAAAEHDEASLRAHRVAAERSAHAFTEAVDALAAGDGRGGGDADALFPPVPAPRCGRCDVRRHCPEGRAAAPADDAWSGLAP